MSMPNRLANPDMTMSASHKKYFLGALLACCTVVALVSGCQTKTLRAHPEFSLNPSQFRTIAVLQPSMDIIKTSLFADAKHADHPNELFSKTRATLAESLTTLLELNGFSAHQLTESEMQDSSLQKLLKVGSEISERVFSTENGENIGLLQFGVVKPLKYPGSGNLPVDAFLYSSYRQWCKSKMTEITQQLLVIAIASAGRTSTTPSVVRGCGVDIDVILISSATGEVLWANRALSQTLITELVAESAMKKFPVIKTAVSR